MLTGAEGPEAGWLEGRSARVVSLEDNDLIVEASVADGDGIVGVWNLRLTPRHSGWTPYSLMLLGIAVLARRPGSSGTADSIGIVTAALDRAKARTLDA
jgi:hypothetical protein